MRYTVEVSDYDGDIRWFKEGTTIFHRIGGPAYESLDGYKCYYVDGLLHNLEGPAIVSPTPWNNPKGFNGYYVKGIQCRSEKEYNLEVKRFKERNKS